MRWKYDNEGQDQYRCCLCCHVRTGTIFIGLFHLFVHIVILSLFAVVLLHPDLVQKKDDVAVNDAFIMDSNTGEISINRNFSMLNVYWAGHHKVSNEDKFAGFLITTGSLFVTILLIYGAVRALPGYLMPFFCLQVFDFCVTCLAIVGYFSYIPNIKKWIAAQDSILFKEELMSMDNDWLMLLVILSFVLVMSFKAYLLGIVWSCYKYLATTRQTSGTAIIRTFPTNGGEDAEMLLPPKYEDVLLMSQNEPPPPAYFN